MCPPILYAQREVDRMTVSERRAASRAARMLGRWVSSLGGARRKRSGLCHRRCDGRPGTGVTQQEACWYHYRTLRPELELTDLTRWWQCIAVVAGARFAAGPYFVGKSRFLSTSNG